MPQPCFQVCGASCGYPVVTRTLHMLRGSLQGQQARVCHISLLWSLFLGGDSLPPFRKAFGLLPPRMPENGSLPSATQSAVQTVPASPQKCVLLHLAPSHWAELQPACLAQPPEHYSPPSQALVHRHRQALSSHPHISTLPEKPLAWGLLTSCGWNPGRGCHPLPATQRQLLL